jgi:hypothetical protein
VSLFAPRPIDADKEGVKVEKNGGKRILISNGCRVVENEAQPTGAMWEDFPLGLDRFKVLASVGQTRREQFEYLEMNAIRRSDTMSLAVPWDWVTVDLTLDVNKN